MPVICFVSSKVAPALEMLPESSKGKYFTHTEEMK